MELPITLIKNGIIIIVFVVMAVVVFMKAMEMTKKFKKKLGKGEDDEDFNIDKLMEV